MAEYVITDGSRFICKNHKNKYVPISNEALADKFGKKQAENVFNNQLPKALKSVFYVQKVGEEELKKKQIKQVNEKDLENNTEKVMFSENVQSWLDRLTNLNGLIKDAKAQSEILTRKLKECNDEMIDIEHYMEFSNLNSVQGYKAYKDLKDCRVKRRHIKNELLVLEIILEQNISDSVVEEVHKRIGGMDKRSYKPRVRTDLFDL